MSSTNVGSAQWTSSSTSTSGRSDARSSKTRRMPQCSSAWEISVVTYVPRGVVGAPTRFDERRRDRPELVEVVGRQPVDEGVELRRDDVDRRRRRGCRPLLQDLRHRPVGDPLAVGEAAAPVHVAPSARGGDLVQQPGLAEPGLSDDDREAPACRSPRRDARAPSAGARARRRGRRAATPRSLPRPATRGRRPPPTRGTGSALPFAVIGSASSNSIAPRQARYVRSSTRRPFTGRGGLEAGGGVQHVAPGHALALARSRASSATIASPVVTPTRTCELAVGSSSFSASIAPRIARPARTARSGSSSWAIGAPKSATTASPMNFSTRPSVLLEHSPEPLVVRREQREHVLGVELLGATRRPDDVDEDGRDRAAFLVPPRRLGRRRVCGERRCAGHAELRDVRVVRAALRANRHAKECRARMWRRDRARPGQGAETGRLIVSPRAAPRPSERVA